MRPPAVCCCLALVLLPVCGCGESSSPPAKQAGGKDYGGLFKGVTAEVAKATSVLKGVHGSGDIAPAKGKLDTIAGRIEGYAEALKSATRPDPAGYEKLRPAAEALKAELQKMSDEERRAAGELGSAAPELAGAMARARGAVFQFTFDSDPMKGELERVQAEHTPAGPAPGDARPPSQGSFGPPMPGGRPSDPREAGRQSLAAFRERHDAARTITVEVDGFPPERAADLCWRLKGQTGATVHASTTSGTHTTVLLYPVSDLEAALQRLDVGRVTGTDRATRTITIAGDPSKVP